jgi:hypothetical protein
MVVAVSSSLRRGLTFQRTVQSLLASNLASTATVTTQFPFSTASSKLTTQTKSSRHLHSRLLSTAQVSNVEVEAPSSRSSEVLVSKEDQHKEEKVRTRISDVRSYFFICDNVSAGTRTAMLFSILFEFRFVYHFLFLTFVSRLFSTFRLGSNFGGIAGKTLVSLGRSCHFERRDGP